MPGRTHLKWQYQFEEIFDVYLQAKNQLHPSRFPWDIPIYCKLVLGTALGMPGYAHPKSYYHLVKNFRVYLQAKNQLHPTLFGKYCKDMQISYFGHAWLHTPKLIVLTCRRLPCLPGCQKYNLSFTSCSRYHILKNPAIWLADSVLAHNTRTRILPNTGFGQIWVKVNFPGRKGSVSF